MTTVFAIAIVVFFYTRKKEKRLRGWRDNTFGYYALSTFVELLRAFLLAMVFYYGLLIVVLFSDSISTGSLVKLESGLVTIRSVCSLIKIPSPYAFIALLGVYWLGFTTFALKFTVYRKRAKRVYHVLAMLCCFTLLGAETGPPALTLAVQIRKNRHEYGVLRDSLRTAVGERATELLVQRIANGFPPPFPRDVNAIAAVDRDIRGLRESFDRITRAGGSDRDVQSFLDRHPPVDEVDKTPLLPPSPDEEIADIKEADISDKSYEDIKASEDLIQKTQEQETPRDFRLQGRIDLTMELFKSVREGLKSAFLAEHLKELPILGMFHDLLAGTLDKTVEGFLNRKADALAASMPKGTANLDRALREAAKEVSASVKVEVTPRMVARYRRPLAEWNIEMKSVSALKLRASKEIQLAGARPLRRGAALPAAQRERLPTVRRSAPVEDEGEALEAFRRGLDSGWVLTRNSRIDPSKIFVHRSSDPYYGLRDLKYVVREEPDGTWTVYRPHGGFGGTEYGRRVGSVPRPPDVSVGECTCQ